MQTLAFHEVRVASRADESIQYESILDLMGETTEVHKF